MADQYAVSGVVTEWDDDGKVVGGPHPVGPIVHKSAYDEQINVRLFAKWLQGAYAAVAGGGGINRHPIPEDDMAKFIEGLVTVEITTRTRITPP